MNRNMNKLISVTILVGIILLLLGEVTIIVTKMSITTIEYQTAQMQKALVQKQYEAE